MVDSPRSVVDGYLWFYRIRKQACALEAPDIAFQFAVAAVAAGPGGDVRTVIVEE